MAVSDRFSQRMLPDQVHRIWDLRAQGVPGPEIARRVGWGRSTIDFHIAEYGGMRPRWGLKLTGRTLSFEEREEIALLRAAGHGVREIARRLERAASTICRELKRNRSANGYVPSRAEALAFKRRRRAKQSRLAQSGPLRERVQADLALKYSPEQISRRLRLEFPDQPEMQVSPETIYQAVYLQARGGLKRELATALRTGRAMRYAERKADSRRRVRIKNMTLIADRPEEVTERLIPGHWEGDLIIGKDGASAIGTIVERVTNYLILVHLPKGMNRIDALCQNLAPKLAALPDQLRRTLTWDQGTEMTRHEEIAEAAGIDIYFADPHSPWQRATNENTNGLLRQYFPKGTDLTRFSQEDLDYVAWEMNDRPRKRLDWFKPSEKIEELLLR
jgi:IS30 family transposase